MQDIKKILHDSTELILEGKNRVKNDRLIEQVSELESEMNTPSFWDNSIRAQTISQKLANLKKTVAIWKALETQHADLFELVTLTNEDDTKSIEEIRNEAATFEKKLKEAETTLFLNGEYDTGDAILEVKVGAGGIDAADWAAMLFRMYLRFAEKKDWKTEILEKSEGEEGGLRSATVEIRGENVFGLLKSEKGGHRLVRRSPFNSAHSRETSFAKVEILPLVADDGAIEIKTEDLKIDTFCASSAGGQHVNRTESAVRLTHLPTGIITSCQNERSQHQNKERSLEVLRCKLAERQLKKREAEEAKLRGKSIKADFGGDTIRSYILDDKRVKDARTGHETHDPEKILDGELDDFIRAYLTRTS
jgi:peptide chain release factor 2